MEQELEKLIDNVYNHLVMTRIVISKSRSDLDKDIDCKQAYLNNLDALQAEIDKAMCSLIDFERAMRGNNSGQGQEGFIRDTPPSRPC